VLELGQNMEKHGNKIEYVLKRSNRVRNVRLSVSFDGVIVTAPKSCGDDFIEKFVLQNSNWIAEKLNAFLNLKGKTVIRTNRRDYLKYKEQTRKLVRQRVAHFNRFYGFKFNRIAIRNQRTLWGSCSGDGNLNFNYALVKLNFELADYVIVHEMCHLWHFNHSRQFWELVGKAIPDYKKKRRELREIIFA